MLYLLDANVLITAATSFYELRRVPEYWAWLKHHGACGNVKVPQEMFHEVVKTDDELSRWLREKPCRDLLLLKESADPSILRYVLDNSYGENLDEIELTTIGNDPFLVVYAFNRADRCVVTSERSQSGKRRRNTKLPDARDRVGVKCISTAQFLDVLDFRTDWNF